MPAAPRLGGREHAAAAAHVTERTLARAVGTATGDAGNARHGAAGTPGLGGGLVTGLYNQKEVWPLFGYEGESFSQGGYIDRGFDDIDWL